MAETHMSWLAVVFFAIILALFDSSRSIPTSSTPADCQEQLGQALAAHLDFDAGDPRTARRCRDMLARRGSEEADRYAARLHAAIRAADDVRAEQAKLEAIGAAARKSDRLAGNAVCGAETWPYLSWRCFVRQVDGQSLPPVRTVTVERHAGDGTSVLVRLPAEQVSARR